MIAYMTAVTAYLCALEAPGTLAAVGGEEVGAGTPVVAGQGAARVRLVLEVGDNLMTAYMTAVTAYLAVGAPEPVDAVACVGEPGVAAAAPVAAEAGHGGPLAVGRHLTAHLPHVANLQMINR